MADPSSIPIEELARIPAPGTSAPVAVAFRPGPGEADSPPLVTYLLAPPDSLDRELHALDPATGETRRFLEPPGAGVREEALSREEQLRRERQREMGLGISRYAWAESAPVLMLPQPDGVWLADADGANVRRAVEGPVLDPQLSPDGRRVAYVRDGELWVDDRRFTHDADPANAGTNGLAEFIAQEEMDRSHGFWWSPDGTQIAYCQVDGSPVPEFRIIHAEPIDEEVHRYPFAGGPNARARLGVVPATSATATPDTTWLDTGDDEYLARVDWFPDGTLAVQTENRTQDRLTLWRIDPATGARTTLLQETTDVWINLHDMFRPLADGGFVWASERTGFRHLQRHDAEGNLVNVVTEGEWQVDSLDAVDEATGTAYFSATRDGVTERHLYAVGLDGTGLRRLTDAPGTHYCVIAPPANLFVDLHSAVDRQPTATLRRLHDDGAPALHTFFNRPDPRVARLALTPPRLTTHGDIQVALYEPTTEPPWPTVTWVYGGPHVQLVANAWGLTAAMRAQYLRSRGYLVVVADNRGSARRGLAFEGAVKHRLGHVEVDDQVAVIDDLVDQGLADPANVGVYGWSYGGYMAAMLLARAPATYKVAVAGAPVTSWDGYDTHYTERYLGTPQDNADGYDASAVFPYTADIAGDLLLVHGMLDENVHFRHTARLVTRLIRDRKRYELLVFPDERHGPRRFEDRVYLEEAVTEFLTDRLSP